MCQFSSAHCLELAEYVARTGVVAYKEGALELPSELTAEQPPATRSDAYLLRLARLGPEVCALAQVLSIQNG